MFLGTVTGPRNTTPVSTGGRGELGEETCFGGDVGWGWGWRTDMERTLNWALTQTPPLHLKPRPSSSADFNMFFLHLVRDLVFLPPKRVWKVLTLRIQVLAYMVEHVFHPSA